jgi:transcriptional regulator with XRE-family HTH domain
MLPQAIHLENIKLFAQKRKMSLTDLAGKIGMTYVGLSKIIRENTTTLSTVLRIATVLNVPVQFFFTDEQDLDLMEGFSPEKFVALKKENQALQEEIMKLKDKIIRLADRF